MEEKERAGPVGHGGPAGTEAVETPHGARRLAVYQRWWRVYDLMWERENPTRAVRSNTNLRTSGSDPTQLATAGSGTTRDREMAADLTTARLRLNEWLSQLSHQPKEQAAQHNPNYNFLSKQRAQLWDLMDDSSSSPAVSSLWVRVRPSVTLCFVVDIAGNGCCGFGYAHYRSVFPGADPGDRGVGGRRHLRVVSGGRGPGRAGHSVLSASG